MKKIALIGCGQLGSRYLQGLAQLNFNINLEIVEPFKKSKEVALERLKEVDNKSIKEIYWFDDIKQLSKDLDLVIISTTADIRANITKNLLNNKNIKNLLLEKVLFQKATDFYEIQKLLQEKQVKCWINHPRRVYPFYQKLKAEIKNKKFFLDYKGSNWGLACNGLHFIDLLAFLTDSYNLEIDNKFLHNKIYDTKRKGFKEINGLLIGKLNEHIFSLFSTLSHIPSFLTITADEYIFEVDESKGICRKWNGKEWKEFKEKIVYFQSELTPVIVENIFKNKCLLPTYEEAMKIHLPFIDSLTNHFRNFSNLDYCPIT